MKYYFLACSLPPLVLGAKPEISFEEYQRALDLNLSQADLKRVEQFKLYVDIKNLKSFWLKKEMDGRGNFAEKELEEAILVKDFLPSCVFEFLDRYESEEYRIKRFSHLLSSFLRLQIEVQSGFLLRFFRFERESRLILSALRAKELRRDIVKDIYFEDQKDWLVAYIIAQKDADTFIVPEEYKELAHLYQRYKDQAKELNKYFEEYRFNEIEKMEEDRPFSIDQILGYMARLMMVEDAYQLSIEKEAALEEVV